VFLVEADMANAKPNRRSRLLTVVLVATLLITLGWLAWLTWTLRFPENAFAAQVELKYDVARFLIFTAGAVLVWRSKPPGWQFTLRNLIAAMLLVAFLAGTHELFVRRGPLLLGFRASREELDALANSVEKLGDATSWELSQKAGWYKIPEGQVKAGTVFLRTSTWWPKTDSGYGFIRIPNAERVNHADLDLNGAGLFHLGGDWYAVYDLYWASKLGWS
jgi:hypothetical protein